MSASAHKHNVQTDKPFALQILCSNNLSQHKREHKLFTPIDIRIYVKKVESPAAAQQSHAAHC